MFTGLVQDCGKVTLVRKTPTSAQLTIAVDKLSLKDMLIGASVACNGVCLTVTAIEGSEFIVSAAAETLAKTTVGEWKEGARVNLERSLKAGDELGGHLVYGHVDGVATCVQSYPVGESHFLEFEVPANLSPFIAQKGSVCLDGISLTVNEVSRVGFSVLIIPHTALQTNLGWMTAVGRKVNIEIDMLARYMARLAEFNLQKAG